MRIDSITAYSIEQECDREAKDSSSELAAGAKRVSASELKKVRRPRPRGGLVSSLLQGNLLAQADCTL